MSTIEGVLALVFLRNLRRGGRCLRQWFAKRVYGYYRYALFCNALAYWNNLFRVRLGTIQDLFHADTLILVHRQVETCSRHVPAFPLRRIAFYSAVQQRFLVRWRRIAPAIDERYTRYIPLPAATPKRRSARLSMKRNARKKLKCKK